MKALVIYDLTGKIWSIIYNQEKAPQGLLCIWVDIPEGGVLERIDLSDPSQPAPVFSYMPETDIGTLQRQVKQMQKKTQSMIWQPVLRQKVLPISRPCRFRSCIQNGQGKALHIKQVKEFDIRVSCIKYYNPIPARKYGRPIAAHLCLPGF